MWKRASSLTAILSIILVTMVAIIIASLLGYIRMEQIHSDYNGYYLILRIQTNNKKPYRAFECQHSSKYFFISCDFPDVRENSTELRGVK